jgi:uncharacterized delta-60 repeat protein
MTAKREEPSSTHATEVMGPFVIQIPESGISYLQTLALASDEQNRIYVAALLPDDYRFYLARLVAEGSQDGAVAQLDTTFEPGGYVQIIVEGMTPTSVSHIVVSAVDGSITLGVEGFFDSVLDFVLCRYLGNGTVDHAFGDNGVVRFSGLPALDLQTKVSPAHAPIPRANVGGGGGEVKLLAAGQMLVVAYRFARGRRHSCLAKVNADGRLDPSFGESAGYTELFFSGSVESAIYRLAVGDDESAVVVCENEFGRCLAARYTASGQFDRAFGSGGIKEFSDPEGQLHDPHIQIDRAGKIVVSLNFANQSTEGTVHLYRLSEEGEPDPDFNQGLPLELTINMRYTASAIDVDEQRRIYVRGRSSDSSDSSAVLSRCTAEGLDPAFGTAGHLLLPGGIESGDVTVQRGPLDPYWRGVVTNDGPSLYRATDASGSRIGAHGEEGFVQRWLSLIRRVWGR